MEVSLLNEWLKWVALWSLLFLALAAAFGAGCAVAQ